MLIYGDNEADGICIFHNESNALSWICDVKCQYSDEQPESFAPENAFAARMGWIDLFFEQSQSSTLLT
jgi:hypothetical protein